MKLLSTDQAEIILEHIKFKLDMIQVRAQHGSANMASEVEKLREYVSERIQKLESDAICDMDDLKPGRIA